MHNKNGWRFKSILVFSIAAAAAMMQSAAWADEDFSWSGFVRLASGCAIQQQGPQPLGDFSVEFCPAPVRYLAAPRPHLRCKLPLREVTVVVIDDRVMHSVSQQSWRDQDGRVGLVVKLHERLS